MFRSPIIAFRPIRLICLLTIAVSAAMASPVAAGPSDGLYTTADLRALEEAFVKLAEDVTPSVVSIQTYRLRDAGSDRIKRVREMLSKGSGMVIDADGLILTNSHVVDDADEINVTLHTGQVFTAEMVGHDSRIDLAVLKIKEHRLREVGWCKLADVRVNQWAFACGNPHGLALITGQPSVTFGVVSGLGRNMTDRITERDPNGYYDNLIETSAPIHPGSSGGPLFNISGQVIGVIAAIETTTRAHESRGFAIPIDGNTMRIIETLKAGEEVKYGFIGVLVSDPDSGGVLPFVSHRPVRGAQIDRIVVDDGPAAKARLRRDDIIVEFDGVAVRNKDHFVKLVSFTPVGREAEVVFVRKNTKLTTTVVLGSRDELMRASYSDE